MAVWSHNQTNCYLCMWRILQYWSFMMFQRKINSMINKELLIKGGRRTQWRKKYYALKVRKFKFNERPLQQFCNNFARISLPFASFDILCSWGRGRNIGFHFLKVTTFNISIWGEIWIFHETEAFTKSVRNCRTAHFKTHPTKTRHVQKTYKSTYKSTYKPVNNQPINPPLNLHNSKQWILQSLS